MAISCNERPRTTEILLISVILSTYASSVCGSLDPDSCEALVTFPNSTLVIRHVSTKESYIPRQAVICPEVEPIGHGYNLCFLNKTCMKISGLIEDNGTCPDFNVYYGELKPVTKRVQLHPKDSCEAMVTFTKSMLVIRKMSTLESYIPQQTVICPKVESIGHGYNVCFWNQTSVKISGLIDDNGACQDFSVEYGESKPVTKGIQLQRKVPDSCEALVTFSESTLVIRNVSTMESYIPRKKVICPEIEPIGHGYNVCFLNKTCVKISGLIEDNGACPDNLEYGELMLRTKRIQLHPKVSTAKKTTAETLELQQQPVPGYISAIIFVGIALVAVVVACRKKMFHSCNSWENIPVQDQDEEADL